MKIFTEPWGGSLFDRLPAWLRLSREAREAFATQIPATLKIPVQVPPDVVEEWRKGGFLDGDRRGLPPEIRPFRRSIRAMHRHRIFDAGSDELRDYMNEHLTNAEIESFSGEHRLYRNNWLETMKLVTDEGWIQSFLQSRSGVDWMQERIRDYREEDFGEGAAKRLKQWIRDGLKGANPKPWSALADDYRRNPQEVSAALMAGIRSLMLFPALQAETLEPVIGIWPGVHHRLTRTVASAPAAVDGPPAGAAVLDEPYLLHDMALILVQCVPDGLRLRQDGSGLFKREADRLAAELPPLPGNANWTGGGSHRLPGAMNWLARLKLTTPQPHAWLLPSKAGRAWLAQPREERLKFVLDSLRKAHARRDDPRREWDSLSFAARDMSMLGWGYDTEQDPEVRLIEAFADYPAGAWIPLEGFLAWQAETANPMLKNLQTKPGRFNQLWRFNSRELENAWRRYVHEFIQERLLPLGGAKAGWDEAGNMWFCLTPAGEYLLGRCDKLECPVVKKPGKILVQSNFEVVFTASAPGSEAEFMHFAERIGHGVGTLFRITRESVWGARDAGLDADGILARMGNLVSKPVPGNVAAQVRDWAGAYRRVAVRRMVTLQCPDAGTARELQAVFPRLLRPVTETLLEITNSDSLGQIRKRLKKMGIGEEST